MEVIVNFSSWLRDTNFLTPTKSSKINFTFFRLIAWPFSPKILIFSSSKSISKDRSRPAGHEYVNILNKKPF